MSSDPYKSKYERRVANQLKKLKVKFKYEPDHFKYEERLRTNARCASCGERDIRCGRRYTPDFRIESNGSYIETKGKWTTKDRHKMIAVIQAHPDKTFRMLFMANNKISKMSKTRYSDFCTVNGIEYAIGEVPPREWLV
jgi:hypothetical protein